MKILSGRVAVVTGAASGIGRGMAESFVEAGMRVVLCDVEADALESTTAGLLAAGADVHAVVADVSIADDVDALAAATLAKYGAVHVLCNNAGVFTGSRPSWLSTVDDWDWIVGVNIMGVVHGLRAFLPIMIDQDEDAHIVNTASIAGIVTGSSALYSATKAAIVALSESVFLELSSAGLRPRVSVLCPGLVDTEIYHSERNRPARFAAAGPRPSGWSTAAAKEAFRLGTSPRDIGAEVVRAIRDERFYVLTHPEWSDHVTRRAHQIVTGENPTTLTPPK